MENTKNIFKGVGISIILTMILLLIFSIVLAYTNVSENTITPVIIIITAISILFGSSISTRQIKKYVILNGGLIGIIYLLLLYTISSLLNWKFGLNSQSIIMIIIGGVFGVIGGIIGVNIKWKMNLSNFAVKSQRKIVKIIDKFIFCIYNQDTFLKIYNFKI